MSQEIANHGHNYNIFSDIRNDQLLGKIIEIVRQCHKN